MGSCALSLFVYSVHHRADIQRARQLKMVFKIKSVKHGDDRFANPPRVGLSTQPRDNESKTERCPPLT